MLAAALRLALCTALCASLARASSEAWPIDAPTLTLTVGGSGVIEELQLPAEQRDKILLHYSEHNTMSAEEWDSVLTNLQLHHRLLALQAENLAVSNGLSVPAVLYYSFLSEFVQDDALVFMRATRSGNPGIYSGFSQSVSPFCEVSRNDACTIPKSEAEAFRQAFQDSFREVQYVGTDGQPISRVTTVLGSILTGIVTTDHVQMSRVMVNNTANPYLQDFADMDAFWAFLGEQLSHVDGSVVPLSWEMTELALSARLLHLQPHTLVSGLQERAVDVFWDNYVGIAFDTSDSSLFGATVISLNGSALARNVSAFNAQTEDWYLFQAGCSDPKAEHCRELYQNLESKIKEMGTDVKFSTFASNLRVFPYRNVRTYAIMAEDCADDTTKTTLQRCTEIFETGNTVVACNDPPLPTNWVVVSVSLVLMAAVIALWVVGCREAKKYDKMQSTMIQRAEASRSGSEESSEAHEAQPEPVSED